MSPAATDPPPSCTDAAATTSKNASPPSVIEVERKFCLDPEGKCLAKIRELCSPKTDNAASPGTKSFRDIYYDNTEKFDLAFKDCWLRQRDDAWELKIPYGYYAKLQDKKDGEISLDRTDYREISDESEIRRIVDQCVGAASPDGDSSDLAVYLKSSKNIEPYSNMVTERESLRIISSNSEEWSDVSVDIDKVWFFDCSEDGDEKDPDFKNERPAGDFTVCEVECVSKDDSEQAVARAKEKVDAAAKVLGIDACPKGESKLMVYLKKIRPNDFEKWMEFYKKMKEKANK